MSSQNQSLSLMMKQFHEENVASPSSKSRNRASKTTQVVAAAHTPRIIMSKNQKINKITHLMMARSSVTTQTKSQLNKAKKVNKKSRNRLRNFQSDKQKNWKKTVMR